HGVDVVEVHVRRQCAHRQDGQKRERPDVRAGLLERLVAPDGTIAAPAREDGAGAWGLVLLRHAARQVRLGGRLVVYRPQFRRPVAVDEEVEHVVTAGAAYRGAGPGLPPRAAGMFATRASKHDRRLSHPSAPPGGSGANSATACTRRDGWAE